MKEQWKKFDSDADLLVHVEEGKTLPIKIEFPISAFTSSMNCCRILLSSLRIFVFLGFLLILGWTAAALYANYFSVTKLKSEKYAIISEQPLYNSQVNKLSVRKDTYEGISKSADGPAENIISITTVSTRQIHHNNVYVNQQGVGTKPLISNDQNVNASKSPSDTKNFDKTESFVNYEDLKQDNLQNSNNEFKDEIIEILPTIVPITNSVNSENDIIEDNSNKSAGEIDKVFEVIQNLSEIESADIVGNLLLEEIINTVLSNSMSHEDTESHEKLIFDNEGEIDSSEEKLEGNNNKGSSEELEDINENREKISLESDISNQDNSFQTKDEIEDNSDEQVWSIFQESSNDSNENDKRIDEDSLSAFDHVENSDNEQIKSFFREESDSEEEQQNEEDDNVEDEEDDDDVDDNDDDETKRNTSDESTYQLDKIMNEIANSSFSDEILSDDELKTIGIENLPKDEELHKKIYELSQKSFPLLAEKLLPIVNENYELLVWYYNDKDNSNLFNVLDKLKASTAKLLYSTNIREFLDDLNAVIDLIGQDSYNTDSIDPLDEKDNKIKNYIIHRLSKKMDMYNFVIKYLQYDRIATLILEALNKSELSQRNYEDFEINEYLAKVFEEENMNDEMINVEEPITENYNVSKRQSLKLLETIKKLINMNDNLSSEQLLRHNNELQKHYLKYLEATTTDLDEIMKPIVGERQTSAFINESEGKSEVVTTENVNVEKLDKLEDDLEKNFEWLIRSEQLHDYNNEGIADTLYYDAADQYYDWSL
ncbi:PREDICTED: protein PFC0760c-like [Ceratosolen solmsi marchali]|uniref:Protein PFC0760c-like n=1 Tax=Ceratosolen solmsi marchali TaxID=326594 RepID=A0AAJ7E2R0_9HYME|nr:PREDICTED: protein PFC0760c-like [Ceratosolen solmsi marchali]